MIDATPAGTDSYILSEGPVWDAETGRVTWVDIEAGAVLSAPLVEVDGEPRIGAVSRVDVGEQVGCAIPLDGGRTLVALTRRLAIVEVDGSLTLGSEILPEGTRFNDGTIDPQGRLVVGSLSLGESSNTHVLLRLEHDGSVTTIDDDLGLSNGLGWSPDGTVFYSIDTEAGRIHRRSYGVGSGADSLGPREVFLDFTDAPDDAKNADGMTVDADGDLWVAFWGGFGVKVFDASGGEIVGKGIRIAAPHSSSVAFVGEDLSLAVVTSASRDLDAAERERWPNAGGLFLARTAARGRLRTPWREVALP